MDMLQIGALVLLGRLVESDRLYQMHLSQIYNSDTLVKVRGKLCRKDTKWIISFSACYMVNDTLN